MAKVNFQINGLEIEDAVVLIVGMQFGLMKNPDRNQFTDILEKGIKETSKQVIELIGEERYANLYSEAHQMTHGITQAPIDKSKLN